MLSVLLITATQDEETAQFRAWPVDYVRLCHADLGDGRLEQLATGKQFEVLHLKLSQATADVNAGWLIEALQAVTQRRTPGADLPIVILDCCADERIRQLANGFPCLVQLSPGLNRDSANAFLATFYETLASEHTVQTAFWMGCCHGTSEADATSAIRLTNGPAFDVRQKTYPQTPEAPGSTGTHRPSAISPAPNSSEFFDKYYDLCRQIEDTIAKPTYRRFSQLLAATYDDDGPVPIDQAQEFSNDFADMNVAIYRGQLALALQRQKFANYRDRSGRFSDLYEWTIHTEVGGDDDLGTWLRQRAKQAYDQLQREQGPGWQQQVIQAEGRDKLAELFLKRDVDFGHVAGIEFSRLMRKKYAEIRGSIIAD